LKKGSDIALPLHPTPGRIFLRFNRSVPTDSKSNIRCIRIYAEDISKKCHNLVLVPRAHVTVRGVGRAGRRRRWPGPRRDVLCVAPSPGLAVCIDIPRTKAVSSAAAVAVASPDGVPARHAVVAVAPRSLRRLFVFGEVTRTPFTPYDNVHGPPVWPVHHGEGPLRMTLPLPIATPPTRGAAGAGAGAAAAPIGG